MGIFVIGVAKAGTVILDYDLSAIIRFLGSDHDPQRFIGIRIHTVFYSILHNRLKRQRRKVKPGVYPAIVISVIDIILVVNGTINKKMTYMENGEVMDGEWTDYTSILMFLGILYLYYVLVSYRKAMSGAQILAFGGFLFFPILDSWITLFNADIDFTYPIVALAFVVIYVIIQEHAIAEDSLRQIVFEKDSLTDPATGFKNRRAYDEAVKAGERGRANGVVYCNVNNLDAIREKDGPEAVDKYVVEFDGILRDSFPGAEICRISENVFVAFLYKITEAALEKRPKPFHRPYCKTTAWHPLGMSTAMTLPFLIW